jgi:hypothetical protein
VQGGFIVTAEEWALAASSFFSGLKVFNYAWIQLATTWAAFALFLVALLSL